MKTGSKTIGERIKEKREEMGLNQKELAKQLNITPSAVNQYEKGEKTPSTEKLVKLAKILGVSSDYLLGASKEKDIFIDKTILKAFTDFKELRPNDRANIMANIQFLKDKASKKG